MYGLNGEGVGGKIELCKKCVTYIKEDRTKEELQKRQGSELWTKPKIRVISILFYRVIRKKFAFA